MARYTHYFPQTDFPTNEAWEAFTAAVQQTLDHIQGQLGIKLTAMAPYDATDPPLPVVVTDHMIRFEGYKDDPNPSMSSHVTAFILERDCRDTMMPWERTNWKAVIPYDNVKPDENGVMPPFTLPPGLDMMTHVKGAFCTTERRRFDLAVTAVLTLAHNLLPGCYAVLSDGAPADWQEAIQVIKDATGLDVTLPSGITEKETPANV